MILTVFPFKTHLRSCTLEEIEKNVKALQYTIKSPVESIALNNWERDSLNIIKKRALKIKSSKPVKNGSSTWYRFTIYEESFPDSIVAEMRMQKLFIKPPSLSGEQLKLFPLRRGFRCNNKVFLITTDAAIFKQELERLSLLLQKDKK
jgi:hypothetical protein